MPTRDLASVLAELLRNSRKPKTASSSKVVSAALSSDMVQIGEEGTVSTSNSKNPMWWSRFVPVERRYYKREEWNLGTMTHIGVDDLNNLKVSLPSIAFSRPGRAVTDNGAEVGDNEPRYESSGNNTGLFIERGADGDNWADPSFMGLPGDVYLNTAGTIFGNRSDVTGWHKTGVYTINYALDGGSGYSELIIASAGATPIVGSTVSAMVYIRKNGVTNAAHGILNGSSVKVIVGMVKKVAGEWSSIGTPVTYNAGDLGSGPGVGQWFRTTLGSFTVVSGEEYGLSIKIYGTTGQYLVDLDGLTFEYTPFSTSFIPNSVSQYTWTRSDEIATLPSSVISTDTGTIEVGWAWKRHPGTGIHAIIFGKGTTDRELFLYLNNSGQLTVRYGNGSGSTVVTSSDPSDLRNTPKDTMMHAAVTWSPSGVTLYYNGNNVGSSVTAPSFDIDMVYLGSTGTSFFLNGYLVYLRSSTVVRSDIGSSIANGSWPIDPNTLYKHEFSGSLIPEGGMSIFTSDVIRLGGVNTVKSTSISWNSELAAGVSLYVYTRLSTDDGVTWGNWSQVTNGGSIPGLSPGQSTIQMALQWKAVFITTNSSVYGKLNNITVTIMSQFAGIGGRWGEARWTRYNDMVTDWLGSELPSKWI